MKILLSLDFYLWNQFIPRIDSEFFKNKLNSSLAIAYISLYKLPRKFVLNYFLGKGKTMVVDTKKLIISNDVVLKKLKDSLHSGFKNGQCKGSLDICQTDVYDPNYKYSVGSFIIDFLQKEELVQINIRSNYRFQKSPDRITRYLHNWLFALKDKGKASDFAVEGNIWIVQMNELISMEVQKNSIPDLRGKLLV